MSSHHIHGLMSCEFAIFLRQNNLFYLNFKGTHYGELGDCFATKSPNLLFISSSLTKTQIESVYMLWILAVQCCPVEIIQRPPVKIHSVPGGVSGQKSSVNSPKNTSRDPKRGFLGVSGQFLLGHHCCSTWYIPTSQHRQSNNKLLPFDLSSLVVGIQAWPVLLKVLNMFDKPYKNSHNQLATLYVSWAGKLLIFATTKQMHFRVASYTLSTALLFECDLYVYVYVFIAVSA